MIRLARGPSRNEPFNCATLSTLHRRSRHNGIVPNARNGSFANLPPNPFTKSGLGTKASRQNKNGAVASAVSNWGYPKVSITRLIAGCFRFFTFTQYFDLPP